MDRAKDAGVGWRRAIRKAMGDIDILWLDPTRKPIDIGVEDDASRRLRKKAKAAGDLQTVIDEMHSIRRVDLRMVDVSDFLVVNLDLDIHACGTYEEIFLANRQKKPVLVHVEQGIRQTPDWLLGTFPREYFFNSWPDLHAYLGRVNSDPLWSCSEGRWYFFNWTG